MDEKIIQTVRETIEEILHHADFKGEVEISQPLIEEEGNMAVNIKTSEDSNFLIGQYGVNLQALQHIARLMIRKKTDAKINFVLDVNSYRQEKNQSIAELAKSAANQAIDEHRAIVLRPMTAYERRLVHMELSQDERVITESIGEGEGRKVVVKPANSI